MNEYCRRSGLLISTFSQWVKKFKEKDILVDDKEIGTNLNRSESEPVEIILVNGIRLRFGKLSSVSEIVRLIKALQLCN